MSFERLRERYPTLAIQEFDYGPPFVLEGTVEDFPFSVTYQKGHAHLTVRPQGAKDFYDADPLWEARVRHGHSLSAGVLKEDCEELILTLFQSLVKADFLWEFAGRAVKIDRTTLPHSLQRTYQEEIYVARGRTPAEALAKIKKVSLTRTGKLARVDTEEYWRLMEVDPTPLNSDDRTYPAVLPAFLKPPKERHV